jgi:hypothetical protein
MPTRELYFWLIGSEKGPPKATQRLTRRADSTFCSLVPCYQQTPRHASRTDSTFVAHGCLEDHQADMDMI